MTAKTPKRTKEPKKIDAELFLTSVGDGRSNIKYQPDDVVFRQGDPAVTVYYIKKGGIQITVVSEQGKEGVIGSHAAGDFFGEGCLVGQEQYLATAHATKPTNVVAIDKVAMLRVLQENPMLSEMFMSFLLTRNIQIEADLIDQLFNSSEKRLARVLLLLANFGKEG